MKITYDEFIKMIPDETKKYLGPVFGCLKYYIQDEQYLRSESRIDGLQTYSGLSDKSYYKAKLLLSTICGLHFTEYSSVVSKYGFNLEEVTFNNEFKNPSEQDIRVLFDICNELFCFYDDMTKYSTLLPIDIVVNALDITSNEIQNYLFSFFEIDGKVRSSIRKLSVDEHTRIDMEKEVLVYQDLPYETINYIETASKIRSLLIKKLVKNEIKESEFIKNEDRYLVPISLLLAIYEYDGENKNSIERYLESRNINIKDVYGKIGTFLYNQEIKNMSRNLEGIEQVYQEYWTDGANKDKQVKDINLFDIIDNLVDRSFTESVIVEKIMDAFNKDISELSNLDEKISAYENLDENSELEIDINRFYSTINKDTKEFIIFSTLVYQSLLKKIKLDKYNKDIIRNDHDIVNLAVFITGYFYGTDINNFYNYYGITMDKVLEFLNIEIVKEEIMSEVLDKRLLLDKFRKFVVNGVNANNRDTESITFNNVSLNLCDRNFNGSMIMENIFEEIRRDVNLPANFYNMVIDFVTKQKKENERREKEEYFKNLPIEDLEYLTLVCQLYKGFMNTNAKDKYDDELLVVLSLLMGLDRLCGSETKGMFIDLGFLFGNILSHLGLGIRIDGDLDIELLRTKFNKYIYEGRNKGNSSPSIQDIALNIFNEELYKSIYLVEYLYKIGLSYDTFKDPKKIVDDYNRKVKEEEIRKQQEEKNIKVKKLLSSRYTNDTVVLINNAVNVYNRLIFLYRSDRDKYKEISSEEDIEVLSFIISILESNIVPFTKIFEKHNLNKDDILEYLGLPVDYQSLPMISESDNTLANVFFKYIKDSNNIMQFLNNNDFYNKVVSKFVKDPTIFKIEIKTGKNYEDTLTVSERIKLLRESSVEKLDLTSMGNVLSFGSSLSLHTAYIQDVYPKIIQSNDMSESTEKIKKLVGDVYSETVVTEESKGFFHKLFGGVPETRKEVKINTNVIDSLKKNIDIQIEKLHVEAQKLTELKEYMEEYYKKNKEYIKILEIYLEELETEIAESRDDIFKISNLNSYKIVLSDKLKTLKLTDSLILQEYVKLNQVIVNHCITINSLVISRNTLLPLISTEIIIGNGVNTEKESLDITKNILALLNDIISQDIVGTQNVLEKLKDVNISETELLRLTGIVTEQMSQITNARTFQNNSGILTNHVFGSVDKQDGLLDNNDIKYEKKLLKTM